jgi:hypothetical protein
MRRHADARRQCTNEEITMNTDQLLAAKKNGQLVVVAGRIGEVNGIGEEASYVYFSDRQRITLFGNDEIELYEPTRQPHSSALTGALSCEKG